MPHISIFNPTLGCFISREMSMAQIKLVVVPPTRFVGKIFLGILVMLLKTSASDTCTV